MSVNDIHLYGRACDYVGTGVNNIWLYGRTTTRELASAGVNNWRMYDNACAMSS